MKEKVQFYLFVAGVIVVFDAVASAASRTLLVDYTKLAWGTYILYVGAGYLGCKHFGLIGGIIAGLVAGFSDATLGWLLSTVVEPFVPFSEPHYSPIIIAVAIVSISVIGAFFGLIGSLLCKLIKRDERL